MRHEQTTLSAKEALAAKLVALDHETDEAIAECVGVGRATLARWKHKPAFQSKVDQLRQRTLAAAMQHGIAEKLHRVAALAADFDRTEQVIRERADAERAIAAHDQRKAMPGGTSGIMVRQWKAVGTGRSSHVVEEFAVDTGLLAARRATLKQAAQELGQWTEKTEATVNSIVETTVTHEFDYDAYRRLFDEGRDGSATAPEHGTHELVDTAHPNGKTGVLPHLPQA